MNVEDIKIDLSFDQLKELINLKGINGFSKAEVGDRYAFLTLEDNGYKCYILKFVRSKKKFYLKEKVEKIVALIEKKHTVIASMYLATELTSSQREELYDIIWNGVLKKQEDLKAQKIYERQLALKKEFEDILDKVFRGIRQSE